MTACVKNHSKRVALAISASLVGALSLGAAAPAVAFAEGVETQFATDTEWENGIINGLMVYCEDDTVGASVSPDATTGVPTYTLKSQATFPLTVKADSITPAGSSTSVSIALGTNFRMRVYNTDADGNPTGSPLSGDKILSAGNYAVVVEGLAGSNYEGQVYKQLITIKGEQLPTVYAYQGDVTADTTFTYSGSALEVNYEGISGEQLVEDVDYSVSYKIGNKSVDSVTNAGTYTATLTGLGRYAGTSTTAKFTVDPFDIYYATVEVDPFAGEAPTQPSRVYWTDTHGQTTYLDPSLVGITGSVSDPANVVFDVTVDNSVLAEGNAKLSSPKTSNYTYKVENEANFRINNAALADSYDVVKSKGDSFDLDDIKAYVGNNRVDDSTHQVTPVSVTMNGSDVTSRLISSGISDFADLPYGTYEVTVNIADTTHFKFAGTKTFTVHVYDGEVNADESLYVYYLGASGDNTAIDSFAKPYDGNTLRVTDFRVAGKDTEGNVVSDGDLKKTLVSGDEDITAAGATKAGDYSLEVTSQRYKLSGTTVLPITIAKIDLTTFKIGALQKWNDVAGEEYVLNSSATLSTSDSAIEALGLVYSTGHGDDAYDSTDASTWHDLEGWDLIPSNVDVRVQYNDGGEWKDVASFNTFGNGAYRVVASVADDVASNYVLPEGENSVTIEFTVAQQGAFKDVQPGYWAYNVIQAAWTEGYMNGTTAPTNASGLPVNNLSQVQNMGVFTPEGTLTRGQVACVLFNASGADLDETDTNYNEHTGWKTGFSDIDGAGLGNQYYAEGVAWAKQVGVINGYPDGTFHPEQPVTREEFISMLANYAKVVLGDDTVGTVSADVLSEFPDAGQVSGWAESNVAWAASKKIAGNGGSLLPADTMTRAYCAAMMVNYLDPELAK